MALLLLLLPLSARPSTGVVDRCCCCCAAALPGEPEVFALRLLLPPDAFARPPPLLLPVLAVPAAAVLLLAEPAEEPPHTTARLLLRSAAALARACRRSAAARSRSCLPRSWRSASALARSARSRCRRNQPCGRSRVGAATKQCIGERREQKTAANSLAWRTDTQHDKPQPWVAQAALRYTALDRPPQTSCAHICHLRPAAACASWLRCVWFAFQPKLFCAAVQRIWT